MLTTKTKPKVLLLNLPGKEAYLRDYYCNNISKSNYLHYPVDLLYLSGTLSENNYEVNVIDALVKKYTPEETLKKISEIKPDYIVSLVGSISWEEDKKFLEQVRLTSPDIKIIGTGDVFLDDGSKVLKENKFFDGCILDFSDKSILNIIEKLAQSPNGKQPLDNCIYKENGSDPIIGKTTRLKGEFSLPMPRHEYFPLHEYRYAFSRNFPTAHLMTDFGCAFNCSFCPIRVDNLGFKVRPINEIIEELKYLKSLGIKELYFRDQTFGANKKRTIELCNQMVQEGLKFSWHCFSRVDVMNEELLDAMKDAGCHTIIFGIESVNEKTLQDVQKKINVEKIKNTFTLCKKKKIRRAATFIIGLPGETEEDIMRTVNFAIEIDCTFASFNVAGIRPGTEWSHNPEKIHFLPQKELQRIRNNAIKKFYLRSSYILSRILEISTPYDVSVLFEEGVGIVSNLIKSVFRLNPKLVRDFE
ncbi:MAG: radical SAM protein [Candidatus Melainabacteria bacterium]|nr:radical SAM protein [Candidatus Melainabacteria bacterium]